jgi:hypothetical protein
MDNLFEHVDIASLNGEQWHMDIALTISVPGCVVTWHKSCHRKLLSHLIPAASTQKISHLLNNKAWFHLDRTLQIKEFASFCTTMIHCADAEGPIYMQAYCTEKNVTHFLNPGLNALVKERWKVVTAVHG